MRAGEMKYTEEQIKFFLAQADSAILVVRKDLGDSFHDINHVFGDSENVFDLVTGLIGSLSAQTNISKEELLARIVAGVLMEESADDSDGEE